MEKYFSVSDVMTFLACRMKWDISSPNRQSLRHKATPRMYLTQGTALHNAIEAQEKGSHASPAEAAAEYLAAEREARVEAYKAETGFSPWPAEMTEFDEKADFTQQLVKQYFDHYGVENPLEDQGLRYLATEVPFKIDISDWVGVPNAYFVGTWDGIAADTNDNLYLVENKGLWVGTPLPTPTGWTTMGEVQTGDQVLGVDGKPCTVVGVSDVKHIGCYRVTFDDGSSIICDENHRWETTTGASQNPVTTVKTVKEIQSTLRGSYGQRDHRIQNTAPLDLPKQDLPVSPYVLGLWLGDGTAVNGTITSADPEVWDFVASEGYTVGPNIASSGKGVAEFHTVYGLYGQLRLLGLFNNKHVPTSYLRSSTDQRLALLQGLMDSDGCFSPQRKEAVFVQKSRAIAEAVRELVVSLGYRAYMQEITAKGFGKTITAFRVTWRAAPEHFRLTRKRTGIPERSTVSTRRLIVNVEAIPSVPTRCITVDGPRSLYLAGWQMVPTHNTYTQKPDLQDLQVHFQTTGYAVAWQMLTGIPLTGALYNGVAKKLIKEPRVLKSGALSTAVDQQTTLARYITAMRNTGTSLEDPKYAKIIEKLEELDRQGDTRFFYRELFYFNETQIAHWTEEFAKIVQEMTDDPQIYRTVPYNGCGKQGADCWYRDVCFAKHTGQDVDALIDSRYERGSYGTIETVDSIEAVMVASVDELREALRQHG